MTQKFDKTTKDILKKAVNPYDRVDKYRFDFKEMLSSSTSPKPATEAARELSEKFKKLYKLTQDVKCVYIGLDAIYDISGRTLDKNIISRRKSSLLSIVSSIKDQSYLIEKTIFKLDTGACDEKKYVAACNYTVKTIYDRMIRLYKDVAPEYFKELGMEEYLNYFLQNNLSLSNHTRLTIESLKRQGLTDTPNYWSYFIAEYEERVNNFCESKGLKPIEISKNLKDWVDNERKLMEEAKVIAYEKIVSDAKSKISSKFLNEDALNLHDIMGGKYLDPVTRGKHIAALKNVDCNGKYFIGIAKPEKERDFCRYDYYVSGEDRYYKNTTMASRMSFFETKEAAEAVCKKLNEDLEDISNGRQYRIAKVFRFETPELDNNIQLITSHPLGEAFKTYGYKPFVLDGFYDEKYVFKVKGKQRKDSYLFLAKIREDEDEELKYARIFVGATATGAYDLKNAHIITIYPYEPQKIKQNYYDKNIFEFLKKIEFEVVKYPTGFEKNKLLSKNDDPFNR